jgi:hypothetical protein
VSRPDKQKSVVNLQVILANCHARLSAQRLERLFGFSPFDLYYPDSLFIRYEFNPVAFS